MLNQGTETTTATPYCDLDAITALLNEAHSSGREHLSKTEINLLLSLAGIEVSIAGSSPLIETEIGIKNTREFGMVISAGVGGMDAELFNAHCQPGSATIHASAELTNADDFLAQYQHTLAYQRTEARLQTEEQQALRSQLIQLFATLLQLANYFSPTNPEAPYLLHQLTLNPSGLNESNWVIGDAYCAFSEPRQTPAPRPIEKIGRMLHPESIGIIGVSGSKMNFGRIILKNIIASGYDKTQLTIIRPDEDEIDGVKCVDSLAALPKKLDLFVVAIAADAVFDLVDEVIQTDAAEAVMLIPGGLGETEASREQASHMAEKMNQRHRSGDGGPIFLGGNCLGIVSHPGGYDTWFIPKNRLPQGQKKVQRNSALISQSGAFMISRISHNPWLDPAYMTALGNQNDLTHGDMLSYFANHDEITTIGVYAEGFKDLDGLQFARAVRQACLKGKQVVLYKAGQTEAGQGATMGHTASIAGDYALCESVLTQAGAIVTSELTEFNDLFYMADALQSKEISGNRLGAVSGAGFEAVGMADSIQPARGKLQMAPITDTTKSRLEQILIEKRLDALMEVRNPIDINPGADDDAHLQCAQAFAEDENVDAVVVGLDPMSPVMRTLEENSLRPGYDLNDEASIAFEMPKLNQSLNKPLIGIVDGGTLYDPLVNRLMDQGVCIFRSCSQGVRALAVYTNARLRRQTIQAQYSSNTPGAGT